MDVLMPDGTIITGVPEGTTQAELMERYKLYVPPPKVEQPPLPLPARKQEPESEGILSGIGRFAGDFAKQFAAPAAAAPFQVPRGIETGVRGLARRSMEGQPEAVMPASVYMPGLDTEETLFGPETQQETAQRRLQAQRAVASIPSIPGTETLSKIGDDVQKSIQGSVSKEGKKALQESQITGNIFKGEIDFGKNPTVQGYALQVANVFGSMAAPIATTLITKSPAAGGAVGGGMAADEAGKSAAEYISKISDVELSQKSPLYAELIAGGASPKEARALTIRKAAETGAVLQGLVATFGNVFTGKLVLGQFDNIIKKVAGKTAVGRAAGLGVVGGTEEGIQETLEGLASDVGISTAVPSKEIGEDSAANLVMGFIGGAGTGGLRGLVAGKEEAPPPPPPRIEPTMGAEPGLPGLVKPEVSLVTAPPAPPAPLTLEEQVEEMLNTASQPPKPAQDQSQDTNAMLQELLTAKGETPQAGAPTSEAVAAQLRAQQEKADEESRKQGRREQYSAQRQMVTEMLGIQDDGSASLDELQAQLNPEQRRLLLTKFVEDLNKPIVQTPQEITSGTQAPQAVEAKAQEPEATAPGVTPAIDLAAKNAEIVQMYRDAGLNDIADQAENSAKYRNTEAKIEEARQVAVDNIARYKKLQGAIAGTNKPIEPIPRTLEDLYFGSEREQDSGRHVPKEVHDLVLNKLNGYIKQLADKGVNYEDVDSRYPEALRDIKQEETQLRSQMLRYANKLKAVERDYKRADFAQFEQAEAELGQMLGVDLKGMREAKGEAAPAKADGAKRLDERIKSDIAKKNAGAAPAGKAAKPAQPSGKKPSDDEKAKIEQEMLDALADLGDILGKDSRLNIVPEQEQKLIPVLTRLMDAAFRLGYIKFKEAAKYVLDFVRSKMGKAAADQVTLDHLQGAYIGMAGKYQDQGASSKKEVVAVETLDELEEVAEEQVEEQVDEQEEIVVFSLSNADNKFEVAQKVADHFVGGGKFAGINEARTFIADNFGLEIRPGTPTAKQADESIEVGVVIAAREIIADGRKNGQSSLEIYDRLVNLYNSQPNLAVRSSTSVANQAYSTPVPLAFVASELAGITPDTTVYEPTGGNGMLTIGGKESNLEINELNGDRFQMLKRLYPNADLTQNDALEDNFEPRSIDVVIENPPFGKVDDISNIDHEIAIQSLIAMKPQGRAVLILGGVQASTEDGRREGYRGKAKREFYYKLYNEYNVVDHFTVGGNMYAKQGTTYPVDVIVIDGRRKSQRSLPAFDLPQLITSYEQLKEKLNESSVVSGDSVGTGGVDGGGSATGQAGGEELAGGASRPSGGTGDEGGRPAAGGEAGVPKTKPADGGQPGTTGGGAGTTQPGAANLPESGTDAGSVAGTGKAPSGRRKGSTETGGPGPLGGASLVSGERIESGLKDRAGQETETAGQVTYNTHSMANSVGTLVPRAMADSIEQSLTRVEAAEGNLDDYVARSLDIDTDQLYTYFSAEQIDALALAIRNAEEGKGFIIGDQTGIGKGRVVAAMIRYALVHDKIPIFVTEAPNLYSDMIRDLDAIGMTEMLAIDTIKPKILITNSDETIPYTLQRKVDDEVIEIELNLKPPKTGASEMASVLLKMQQADSLGEYKVIFTTYKQMQTQKGKMTERMRFVRHFGANNYMIFDESHNAGGAGQTPEKGRNSDQREAEGDALATGRAGFVRGLVNRAFGTFFSSATYAKKPDVMDLYSSTDMKLAVNNISELSDAIKNGGIPMQQAVAQMLAQAGQYIRRERTFAGIAYDTVEARVDKAAAENMATSMRDVLMFSRAMEPVVRTLQSELDQRGAVVRTGGERTTVQGTNFGSIMHSLIDQMLLGLKTKDSVNFAIGRLQNGEKVVMTVANTMGSFLQNFADDMNLSTGDTVNLSFADLYLRYLDKQRKVKIKYPSGTVEEYYLTDENIGPQLAQEYERIENFIRNAGFGDVPISPIDYMHAEFRKAGYNTEEITGRTLTLSYENGEPVLTRRKSDIRQRVNAVKGFNNGAVDVIILNQAGSTGLSLHASGTVKDKRKRNMILVQAEKNIDTHMQMLGRIHRTGQVTTGPLDVPARRSIAARGRMLRSAERGISGAKGKKAEKLAQNVRNKMLERIREEVAEEGQDNVGTSGTYLGKPAVYGLPAFSQMMADIPAEMRPAAVLLKKMASLSANTTASRKSAVSAEGVVDFMNDYGGQVAMEYLRDNPEVYREIGGPDIVRLIDDPTEANEEVIRKLTGYIPVLPIKLQEEIYKDLVDRYNDLIQREDSMGTNKLEAKAADLDAKTISSKQITEDKGDPSVFAQPAFMERVDVKRTVKPFSKEEVQQQVKDNLKGMTKAEFRNIALQDTKTKVAEYGRAEIAKMTAANKDAVAIEQLKNDLNAQFSNIKTIIDTYPIGTPVSIKNTNGVFVYGVITNIESKGKTKNPVAGSDWKMTFALANGDAKSITVNFSQIGKTYTLTNEPTVSYLNPETLKNEQIPLEDMFDRGATVRREKRWMVTGNILAGYAAVGNIGQILNYTKDDGTTAQGILMSRTFDFERQQKNAPVKLSSVEKVMAFFNQFGAGSEVSTENGVLKIKSMGYDKYRFTVPSSKRDGGSYYLDKDLTRITADFYKSGPTMSTTVYGSDINKALQYIMAEREESIIAVTNKDEARAAFQVPLKNVQPDAEMLSLNPDESLIADRKANIEKYREMRQRRAALMRKFEQGQAGLEEQREMQILKKGIQEVKRDIDISKPERRSAKNFFADATKAWDRGDISDDVYAAITTLYKKFPFVLEELKFSVKKSENDSAAGQFLALPRIVRLYKGTNGVTDPSTIRHEIVHSLEQMMSPEVAMAVFEDYIAKLERAINTDKSPKAQAYFKAVLAFLDAPSQETYDAAMAALPSYAYYQYMNPSEYWAVNAEKLMARKLGTGWDRFVLAVKKLYEGLKNLVGFDNQYVVHRTFDDIMNARAGRVTNKVVADYVGRYSVTLANINTRRNYKGGPAPLSTWTAPNESNLDDFFYRIQDKHIDTKRVLEAITREAGDIEDRFDVYMKEELYHGRVARQTADFLKDELQPLLKDMAKRGVKLEDFEEYLQNRTAPDRNALIASRNPMMPDGGSGIFNDEARDYMRSLDPNAKKNFEDLAKEIDKIVRGTQDVLVDNGLEKAETIKGWRESQPLYVPLNRDPDELDFSTSSTGLGQGFSTRGSFTKSATGSLKTVVDILGNIALQREKAIIKSEKSRIGRALYGLAILNPNPDFWMAVNPAAIKNKKQLEQELLNLGLSTTDKENIIQEPRVPRFDKATGQITYAVNPNLRGSENVFAVRINGEDRFVFFNPGDPRAIRMVQAIKNLDADGLSGAMGIVAEVTRTYAALNTQYNPVFGAWNFIRDTTAGAINLSSTPIANRKLEVLAGSFPALRAIYRNLREKGSTTPEMKKWVDLFDRFQKAGGQTGYREQFSRSKAKATIIERELANLDAGNARKAAKAVFDWLSDYNDAMENAVRLSAFKAALDEGLSEERAASLAKNLTVNFNRKGQSGTWIGALFAFFNASVQGTARMAETLSKRLPNGKYVVTNAGKKIIAGGIAIGVFQAVALAMAGFDDDEPPEFLKNKNLIIPTSGGNYLIIPMPLGLNVFPNVGRTLTEFAMSNRKDAKKLTRQMFSIVIDSFNPLGSSGLLQTAFPTITDPIVALAENKDAFGRPIYKADRATNPTPGYERNRESSTAVSQGLAYALNYMTGGGEYGIGLVSPTADQIDYLAAQYTGGVGREVMKAARAIGSLGDDEEMPPYKKPILGKMYGETTTPSAISSKFYSNVITLAEHEGELRRMKEKKASTTEYKQEYPETRLINRVNQLENQITKLNNTIKDISEKPESDFNKDRIKRLKEQKTRMMKQFNKAMSTAQQ